MSIKDQINISYEAKAKTIKLEFPKSMTSSSGELALFRPSNKFMDKKFKLKLNNDGSMDIPLGKSLTSGLWHVQLDWISDGKSYYVEESIVL